MGICVSSHAKSPAGIFLNSPAPVQVIHWNGRLQELWHPTGAGEILSHNPDFFLCSSESMNVGSLPWKMTEDDHLMLGQLYFLIPMSKVSCPFSLQDLCTLAVKACNSLRYDSGKSRLPVILTKKRRAVVISGDREYGISGEAMSIFGDIRCAVYYK